MKFLLEIDCDNDAFAEDPIGEVRRILQVAGKRLEDLYGQDGEINLYDINGNAVGFMGFDSVFGRVEAPFYIKAMAARLGAAETVEDLDVLYLEWIGYSVVLDDPTVTFHHVYDTLKDYVKESCCAAGVHVSVVFPE